MLILGLNILQNLVFLNKIQLKSFKGRITKMKPNSNVIDYYKNKIQYKIKAVTVNTHQGNFNGFNIYVNKNKFHVFCLSKFGAIEYAINKYVSLEHSKI